MHVWHCAIHDPILAASLPSRSRYQNAQQRLNCAIGKFILVEHTWRNLPLGRLPLSHCKNCAILFGNGVCICTVYIYIYICSYCEEHALKTLANGPQEIQQIQDSLIISGLRVDGTIPQRFFIIFGPLSKRHLGLSSALKPL